MKKAILKILTLFIILCAVSMNADAQERTPTRTETLTLGDTEEKNEAEGWEWKPDAAGGGTLTLNNCYIKSETRRTIYFGNIAEAGSTVTIVLKGENIIETTDYNGKSWAATICSNINEKIDVVIKEDGTGSLNVRTSEPIVDGNTAPIAFHTKSFKVESGSITTNIQIGMFLEKFWMAGGSLVVKTPEKITNVFGICSVKGPVNITGGTLDITAGHIGIITNGEAEKEEGKGWSVNISGGDVKIKAMQSCIQMQNSHNKPGGTAINITGGTFYGESDTTGIYAENINIVKEGDKAPQVTISSPGGNSSAIKAIHAKKKLVISDSIVTADTINNNIDNIAKENSIIVEGEEGQVYGNVTLDSNLTIPTGATLTIPEGATLEVPENITLEIPAGASFVNNGTLVLPENAEKITVTGTGVIKKGDTIYGNDFKKLYPDTMPEKRMQVANTVKTVADIALPDDWSLEETDSKKAIPAGGSVEITANYTGQDKDDYSVTSVSITVTRAVCEENSAMFYTGAGEQAPDCTTAGIGHTECKLCGDIVRQNVKVPATGHTAGTPVITKADHSKNGNIKRRCTVCNALADEKIIYAIDSVYLTKGSDVYNGKTKKPSVTVKDSKGNTLKKNTDYTVSYPKTMKKVGVYTVKITFRGNYAGGDKLSYKIVPKKTAISKLKAKKKGFTLKWKKQTSQTTGYEIQYSTNKKFTKKTTKLVKIKKNKTVSKTISRRKANKKYYVRIRTYKNVKVNGKTVKITSGWSKTKTVRTKK